MVCFCAYGSTPVARIVTFVVVVAVVFVFVDVMVDIVIVLVVHKATGGVVVDVDVCFFVAVLLFCVRFLMFLFLIQFEWCPKGGYKDSRHVILSIFVTRECRDQ